MTDQNAIRNDISFLRTLAEEGRDAPLNAGASLFSSGMIFGLASAGAVWGGMSGAITNGWTYTAIFFGAAAIHSLVMWRIRRARSTWQGAGSRANVATNLAWTGVAAAIFTTTLALIAVGVTTSHWQVMLALPPVCMATYGAAWTVAAAVTGQRWIWGVALACFGFSIGGGLAAGTPAVFYGLFCAAVFLVVALPGLVLMLKARRAAA
jgi:hypothetical protein